MELLQLKYFFESAKTESFAKTAEKYMVPASSVSASIKRLEQDLNCKLFDRSCNRIKLNDNGRRLQQSLCVVFDELEQAVEDLSTYTKDAREIKLLIRSVRAMITNYIIEFKKKYPLIKFKTVFDFDETDFEQYDIIIDIDERSSLYPNYEQFELSSRHVQILASIHHPLQGKTLMLKQLCNQPFVTMGEQSNLHQRLIRACKRADFTPNIVVQSNDGICYRRFIEEGVAIGLGRGFQSENQKEVAALNVIDFNERYTTCVYYKKQSAYGNIQNFIDFLKKKGS